MGRSSQINHRGKPDIRTYVGRANESFDGARLASSGLALVFTAILGAGLFTDLDLGNLMLKITMIVAWISVALACFRLLACLTPRREPFPMLEDDDLPTYTVLIPIFREAHMVPGLIKALSAANYPPEKLDIIFICEACDSDTASAAQALSKPPFRSIVVPPVTPGGEPQTKPRALNYALARSKGDLVTIYDAEDRPHPDQLRQAASAFAVRSDWMALQAPLRYFNTKDSPLAAQFGLEYDGLFQVLLPFYDRLGLPFPLGGTSNHMRRSALDRVDGWDAFNVTEDADLAFRLAADGGRIGWISPPTQEEAVAVHRPWTRQRSRWLKGYMQTWLVHMQTPFVGGWRRALMLQLTLSVSLLSVMFFAPVMFVLVLIWLAQILGVVDGNLPLIYLSTLGFSLLCGMATGALGAIRSGHTHLLRHVPFMPLYWLLLFAPLVQAFIEMRTRPFHWHKTEHGVTGARLD